MYFGTSWPGLRVARFNIPLYLSGQAVRLARAALGKARSVV